jgi:tetratricopeptide (TPR) repeat protein
MKPCRTWDPDRPAWKLRLTFLAFYALPIVFDAAPAHAASPDAARCDKQRAQAAFSLSFDHYGRRKWAEAIPGLEEAIGLCPKPDGLWIIPLGFGKAPYIPFFYLGRCHYELKDHPAALRQLYLSGCFEEPARSDDKMKDFDSMTAACLKNIKSPQRPQKHSFFSDGFFAYEQEQWDESAEKMWDSLMNWPEDGETTYSNGRWPEAYLPRFQLAKALNKLGCHQQACKLLEQSLIKKLLAEGNPRVKTERKDVLDLAAACADIGKRDQTDEMTCQRWECWLKERRQ